MGWREVARTEGCSASRVVRMPCESWQRGTAGRDRGTEGPAGMERCACGKERDQEGLLEVLPRRRLRCTSAYVYTPKEGQSPRGQESRGLAGRRGTTDSDLVPRSQGHYLIIQVLSLFSPENMVLK